MRGAEADVTPLATTDGQRAGRLWRLGRARAWGARSSCALTLLPSGAWEESRYGCRVPRSRSRSEPVERPADLDAAIPFPPMEAELVRELPEGDGWQYEPKWDGFRGLLENASGEVRLWSRNARPLLRYFPELRAVGEPLPPRSCLDGEIVIVRDGVLDFDAMQTRLHPAESRVRKLSAEIPAIVRRRSTCSSGTASKHWQAPLAERRATLEQVAGDARRSRPRRATATRRSSGSRSSSRSASTA